MRRAPHIYAGACLHASTFVPNLLCSLALAILIRLPGLVVQFGAKVAGLTRERLAGAGAVIAAKIRTKR